MVKGARRTLNLPMLRTLPLTELRKEVLHSHRKALESVVREEFKFGVTTPEGHGQLFNQFNYIYRMDSTNAFQWEWCGLMVLRTFPCVA